MAEQVDDQAIPREPADDLAEFGFDDDRWLDHLRVAVTPSPLGSIGPYELLEEVSRGGQGIVYRARDSKTNRTVAIKRLLAGSLAVLPVRVRFEREVQAAAALNHPNIVTTYGFEVFDGQALLVMEWIDGVSITEWARGAGGGPPSMMRIVETMIKVCDAVHHAHQRGVIHRDLKPSNILLDATGEPHVLDFGMAKHTEAARDVGAQVTLSGQFVGTPAYASPEQVDGAVGQIDVRTDVYSLGVMLYEVLAGALPYDVSGPLVDIFRTIRETEAARLTSTAPSAGRDLEAISLKALAKSVERRYQSVEALARDLRRYLAGEPVEAKGNGRLYLIAKTVRRNRIPFAIAASFLVLLAGFSVTMALLYGRAEREASRAIQVQDFLEEMLVAASPYRAGGDLTVVEMLESASERIATEFAHHPRIEADLRYTIARVYAGLWMWGDARENARIALDRMRTLHEGDHPDTAACMTLLGRALTFLRDEWGVDLQRQALAMRRRLYGDEHPLVAETLGTLGFALWLTGDEASLDEAASYYEASIDLYRRAVPGPDPDKARVVYSFAMFNTSRGQFAQAEPLFREALGMYRAMEGSGDIYMAQCLDGYASFLINLDRLDEAEPIVRECISLQPAGSQQYRLTTSIWRLGTIHLRRGEVGEALQQYCVSMANECEWLASSHPSAEEALRRCAVGLRTQPLAESPHREAFSFMVEMSPMSERDCVDRMYNFGEALHLAGRSEEAVALLEDCLSLAATARPIFAHHTAEIRSLYGASLTSLGRYEDAEDELLASHAIMSTGRRESLARSADRLVVLYERWGRHEDAARFRRGSTGSDDAEG